MTAYQDRRKGSPREYPIRHRVNRTTELQKASDAVKLSQRMKLRYTDNPIPYVSAPGPMSRDGLIKIYLLDCGWVCGNCSKRITASQLQQHAWYHI